MASKIAPEYVEQILQMAAKGQGVREIAAWLTQECGVPVSKSAIARLVQKEGVVRSQTAKTVARAHLAISVTTDIDRTSRLLKRALLIAKRHQDDEDPGPWTKPARVAIDLIALRAKLAGIEQPDEQKATAIVVLPAEESD